MLSQRNRSIGDTSRRRSCLTLALPAALAVSIGTAPALYAQDPDPDPPPVSLGAGLQSSFLHRQADDADATDHFRVNSLRLYVNGSGPPTTSSSW